MIINYNYIILIFQKLVLIRQQVIFSITFIQRDIHQGPSRDYPALGTAYFNSSIHRKAVIIINIILRELGYCSTVRIIDRRWSPV